MLLVVATRASAEAPPEYQRLAYLPRTQRIRLRGLAPEGVRDLLAQSLGVGVVPDEVWQLIAARAQGNPFFSEELAFALRDSGMVVCANGICRVVVGAGDPGQVLNSIRIPDTVQGLITSRIDRLTPPQQLTLKVASVIGQSFALATLQAVHPVEHEAARLVDQLFTLQQAGLVVIESFELELVYAFKNAVAAEVAYNLMSFGQRRRLHRALAERYDRSAEGGPPAQAAQLAHHWRQADEPARAMGYLAQAGEQALRTGAYREAGGFLRQALLLAEMLHANARADADPPTMQTQGRWERQLGEAYHGMGRLVESRALLERAAARLGYPVPERVDTQGRELVRELLRQAGRRLLGFSLAIRGDGMAIREAARAYAMLAQLAYYDSQLLAGIYAALRSLNLAEQGGLSPELARAYATTQLAAGAFPPLAAMYRRRAQAAARALGHLPTDAWVAEAQGIYYVGHGNWKRARAAFVYALAIANHLGDQRRRIECRAMLGLVAHQQGEFAAAMAQCAELQAVGERHDDAQVRAWGLVGLAENLLNLGEIAQATTQLELAEGLLAENVGSARAEEIWAYALMARAALRRDEPELALALAAAAAALIGPVPPAAVYALGGYSAIAEIYLELWERAAPAGKRACKELADGARQACRNLSRFALIFPMARPVTLHWQGLDAWLRGRPGLARRRWTRALALAGELDMPYEQARAHLQLGRHALGNHGAHHLLCATSLFERLAAAYDVERVRGYL